MLVKQKFDSHSQRDLHKIILSQNINALRLHQKNLTTISQVMSFTLFFFLMIAKLKRVGANQALFGVQEDSNREKEACASVLCK